MTEIVVSNVSKRWGSFGGVHDFDRTIADREFLVLLGPSDCGKTTAMRMVAGLEDPSSGEAWIDGRAANDLEPEDRNVAMAFRPGALHPDMNVDENIRFPLTGRGVGPAAHDEWVRRASAMVELDDFLHRMPAELSGGQRERVAPGRAIVRKPVAFLMDEPLSNLDAEIRVFTRAQIKNLGHELAVTAVCVTHDQIEAMTRADRVVVMKQGVVQQVGTPPEIYDRPANAFVASFIGSPAMNLVDGEIAGSSFKAESALIEGLSAPEGPLTLGFRAEDAEVVAEGGQINARICKMARLRDATVVSVRIGGSLASVKADKNYRAEIDDTVSIRISTDLCHLFDAKTGERIGD